jgi:hypothetical protein
LQQYRAHLWLPFHRNFSLIILYFEVDIVLKICRLFPPQSPNLKTQNSNLILSHTFNTPALARSTQLNSTQLNSTHIRTLLSSLSLQTDVVLSYPIVNTNGTYIDYDHPIVNSSRFRGYHTALATQADYINALKASSILTESLASQYNLPIFPYSVFYIFFEQYLYISNVALISVGVASGNEKKTTYSSSLDFIIYDTSDIFRLILLSILLINAFIACLLFVVAVFFVTLFLLGNVTISLIVVGVVLMIEVDVMGVMVLWGKQLLIDNHYLSFNERQTV